MCGRYSLKQCARDAARDLRADHVQCEFEGRLNIAPTQLAPVAIQEGNVRILKLMKWGLIPGWSKDDTAAARCINARIETVAEKPTFRSALKKRRCLVPATDFYEWLPTRSGKQPFCFQRRRDPMCFAGLWETWRNPAGETVESFTIITQPPVLPMQLVHDRMPKILGPDQYDAWLDPARFESVLQNPFAPPDMDAFAISRRMSHSSNNKPEDFVRLFGATAPRPLVVGQTYPVRKCPGGYDLPDGLKHGDRVSVLNIDVTCTVEFQGKRFELMPPCLDPGRMFQIDGAWINEDDLAVSEAWQVERLAHGLQPPCS